MSKAKGVEIKVTLKKFENIVKPAALFTIEYHDVKITNLRVAEGDEIFITLPKRFV